MIKQYCRIIGQGGQCTVYKHFDDTTKTYLAVKSCDKIENDKCEQLKREARILQQFNCEFIIKIRKTSETESSFNVYMDYAKYGSLETVHQRFKPKQDSRSLINSSLITIWLMQTLIALCDVHAQGYIHGDIKPQNILIFEKNGKFQNPVLVLIDFGVSMKKNNDNLMQQTTYTYMSPQQVAGEKFSEKTDIYSLGIVFYWIITKRFPFIEYGREEKLLKMHKHDFIPITMLVPDFDSNMAHVVEQMLQYDENDRPSAQQLLQKKLFKKRLEKHGFLQYAYDLPANAGYAKKLIE